ncbi:hypothetical protein [Actinophytocola sp. NPDC049390]|uniref:hypothetical protein n=1 Tax=Actinophytocola sp. NPDC049390 TaxID=3363894 RepID=UPI0037BD932D
MREKSDRHKEAETQKHISTPRTDGGHFIYADRVVQNYNTVHAEIRSLENSIDDLVLLSEVFGVNVDVPRNYTPRINVDDALVTALSRRKHVVIHGSSKQGKTCLRKKYLGDDAGHVALTCSANWSLSDLHLQILKAAGYRQVRQEVITSNSSQKATGKVGGKIQLLKTLEITAEAAGEAGRAQQIERTVEHLTLDPSDANDVIAALRDAQFDKIVVLEDFHYLQPSTQQDFSVALKAYHDSGQIQVVIVGVWLDRNRLIQFNGDLSGRIESINVDNWTPESLAEVIKTGADIIGLDFDPSFSDSLIRESRNSVWIVQEICYSACQRSGVVSDQGGGRPTVGKGFDVQAAVADIVDSMSSRFLRMIAHVADKGRSQTDIHKWIIAAILVSDVDQLSAGVRRSELRDFINTHRPGAQVDEASLTRALNSLTQRQLTHGVRPIVLDYDHSSGTINIVDRSFLLWLVFKKLDMRSIFEEAQLPAEFIQEALVRARQTGRHSRPTS